MSHIKNNEDITKNSRKNNNNSDAMRLPINQRRQLMDKIMEDSRRAADDAAAEFIQNNPSLSKEALEDEVTYIRFKTGIDRMLELNRMYGFPIARYDCNSKLAYIEYADGHKEYIEDIIKSRTDDSDTEKT